MEKKKFKKTTNMIFSRFNYKVLAKHIYKDYGLFLLKIKSYKSNYSDEYYFDSYIIFKDANLALKENLIIDDMILGSRLQSSDGTIFSFDYKRLDEKIYIKQLSQIVASLDNSIMKSPLDYLTSMQLNYFNSKGKDKYLNIIGLSKKT